MLDLKSYRILTFDCYGTLVDWESGIAGALGRLLAEHGLEFGREELLAHYARFEPAAQAGEFRPYREILAAIVDRFGEELSFTPTTEQRQVLAETIGEWPVFADTRAALRRLAARYRLAILSNIDDDLFARTAPHLGVEFETVITAQQVGSYKPAPGHFHAALERLGDRGELLHVAQSLFHDVAIAGELGITTVWVNRRRSAEGGATPPSAARPDLEVADLAELATLVG